MGREQLAKAMDEALARARLVVSCDLCGGATADGLLVLFLLPDEPERHCEKCGAYLDRWNRPVGWPQPDGTLHITIVRDARGPPEWYAPRSSE